MTLVARKSTSGGLNDFIGSRQHVGRNRYADLLSGLQVDSDMAMEYYY